MSHTQPEFPFQRSLQRLQGVFWRRRFIHWLIRAIWLTLLVPVVMMVGYFMRNWPLKPQIVMYGMLLVGGLVILWAVRPIALAKMVQRLDKRLTLRARLMTAFEMAPSPIITGEETEQNQVINRLLQESVQIITNIRSQVRLFNRFFWLEVRALMAVVALLVGLLMLNLIDLQLPEATSQELPQAWQEPSANNLASDSAELGEITPMEEATQQQSSTSESQIRSALEIIADALRDQATSRAVADEIDQGNYHEAAEELRRLADRLDGISRDGRQELGDSLQQAADEIGDGAPEFTEPLQAGSAALANDDIIGGGQALEDLAEAIDSLAETSPEANQSNQEQQQEQSSPEETESEEGGVEQTETQVEEHESPPPPADTPPEDPPEEEQLPPVDKPLELESDFELEDRTLEESELDATGDNVTQDSPFAKQPLTPTGDLGPDPLTYPWEKRELIRSYFTP